MALLIASLRPQPFVLAAAVLADLVLGDPVYALHPIRLMGRGLSAIEGVLRRAGADGYVGGIVLFVMLGAISSAVLCGAVLVAAPVSPWFGWAVHGFVLYSLLALGDLLAHGRRIEAAVAAGDLISARRQLSNLVGRDTDTLDAAGCRRAVAESLSENLTDGFISPLCWYVVGGLPGIVLFKVVSTMDSMVGYKTPKYLRFGWCGARLDDLMNFVPARLAWLLVGAVAVCVPGCDARKAWRIGWAQHDVLPSPNSGWSEAAAAGAVQRRLVGPVYAAGRLVTDVWLGDVGDPPLATGADALRMTRLVRAAGLAGAGLAIAILAVADIIGGAL